ncbi:hypothetical protein I3842_01G102800 [Carya illinoinensis]|uniref:Uncharacterized protein n=1 Tax=Carya illinoinensis TaxID=32201 RepID=A0A922K6R3_CARIL|nr:hypothetical protein I3842_01G102800 [Carya illinoinensis]
MTMKSNKKGNKSSPSPSPCDTTILLSHFHSPSNLKPKHLLFLLVKRKIASQGFRLFSSSPSRTYLSSSPFCVFGKGFTKGINPKWNSI